MTKLLGVLIKGENRGTNMIGFANRKLVHHLGKPFQKRLWSLVVQCIQPYRYTDDVFTTHQMFDSQRLSDLLDCAIQYYARRNGKKCKFWINWIIWLAFVLDTYWIMPDSLRLAPLLRGKSSSRIGTKPSRRRTDNLIDQNILRSSREMCGHPWLLSRRCAWTIHICRIAHRSWQHFKMEFLWRYVRELYNTLELIPTLYA